MYFGVRVLRFENKRVFEEPAWVLTSIREAFRRKLEKGEWIDD